MKLHMIGNAHLDPVWLWTWQEGFLETKATFQSVLDRLNEYDDFIFTSSSAQYYEWVEVNAPDMFEKIKKRIQEGRWIICGGWWVQPDCNLPCGESFARHALIAQNYFYEKFGVISKAGYNVDSFGHNGMLPQILRLSGMEHYVFMRPGPHEKELPGRNFIWESDDGSQVTVFQIPFSYCTFGELESHIKACINDFDPDIEELMCFYGVGNHGGGPTVDNIETIKALQKEESDVEILFDNPNHYFEELKRKQYRLPVVHGDLQHHACGCYSAQSEVKTMNRRSENALIKAEKFASLSAVLGKSVYPDNFTPAWKRVLFNQFHDILAGSSIQKAYDDARNEFGEALSIAARNENNALCAISFSIDIDKEEGMIPVVVFNPHSWEVNAPVEVEIGKFQNQNNGEDYMVLDSDGSEIMCQNISTDAKINGRSRIVFLASIPALGYETYRIYASGQKSSACSNTSASNILENKLIRIKIDDISGGVSSLYDKKTSTEFLADSGAVPVVFHDESDTWSHDVTGFNQSEGYFKPISIKKVEEGAVRSSIRVISRYMNSTFVQTFTLYHDSSDIHVTAKINWQEKFKCLKLQFPMKLHNYRATYEIPFGSIVKECNGEEEAAQKWMDLSGLNPDGKMICGMSLLNENKYSMSVNKNVMYLTILRSPVYAHHDPYVLQEEIEDYRFIDQGIQEFRYRMVPHTGTWKDAGTVQKAQELNQSCTVIIETFHKGNMPSSGNFIRIDCPNIILSSLKKSEKSEEYILRIYEFFGKQTEAEIDIPLFGKTIKTRMMPYEIKTFALDANAESGPYEVNFLEWKTK